MTDITSQVQQFSTTPIQQQQAGISVGAPNIDPSYAMIMNQFYPQTQDDIKGMGQLDGNITKEKERIANRLGNFNPKDNIVWREITQRFGASIKQPELLSIATVLAQNANVKLDRDAKRRKSVLIKWFEENWTAIHPFLDYVVLEESHNQN